MKLPTYLSFDGNCAQAFLRRRYTGDLMDDTEAITYGTALSATQLDATATYNGAKVAGTFTYRPAKGTVLRVGMQKLSAVFTPSNTTDYTTQTATNTITVKH